MEWESGLSSWRKAEDIGGEDDVDWTEQTHGEGEIRGGDLRGVCCGSHLCGPFTVLLAT